MAKELLKVKPCNCGHQWCVPFASRPYLFGVIPFPITIMCLACNKKVTRFTIKSAVKRWNEINNDGDYRENPKLKEKYTKGGEGE